MTSDFLLLVMGCVGAFAASATGLFLATVIGGFLLAGLCWYLCTVYTHLWNRQYRVTIFHQVLCAFASIFTLVFVIMFASLAYTKDVALVSIGAWQARLNTNHSWAASTFGKAYRKVEDLQVEDFSNFPPPPEGQTIPITHDESRDAAALVYANEACRDFDETRPFLSKIVWSRPQLPAEVVSDDAREWLKTHPLYPADRAIDLAASQIRSALEPQTPRIVYLSRMVLVGLFLFVQAIPFGIIGWAAYVDIKART